MVDVIIVIVSTELVVTILVEEIAVWVKKTSILIDEESLFVVVALFVIASVIAIFLLAWTAGVTFRSYSSFYFSYARLLLDGTIDFILLRELIPVSFFGLKLFGWMHLLLASINLLKVLSVPRYIALFV